MTKISKEIADRFVDLADHEQARHLMRFFKTGKGEYGEGDKFLGLKVPQTRGIVKEYRAMVDITDIQPLLNSPWHEIRLAGFLLLIELYKSTCKKADLNGQKSIIEFYLRNIERGNNWDLVDLVAPKLLGRYLLDNPDQKSILYNLSQSENLWKQRVAIVATFTLIREGQFDDTFNLAESYLTHPHDLIHKASGWMLREVGKRGAERQLIEFLRLHKQKMPRTMYRYAIERLSPDKIP